ncbi:unnamed protein product, partial [Mesorhabditis belari]|uniref:Uncharacterized protein n=1 Tax=Mesorhabditis belari TaxID=2138241 RepID=A0AAF3EER7_9BILA
MARHPVPLKIDDIIGNNLVEPQEIDLDLIEQQVKALSQKTTMTFNERSHENHQDKLDFRDALDGLVTELTEHRREIETNDARVKKQLDGLQQLDKDLEKLEKAVKRMDENVLTTMEKCLLDTQQLNTKSYA